jgi:hypothetical protein
MAFSLGAGACARCARGDLACGGLKNGRVQFLRSRSHELTEHFPIGRTHPHSASIRFNRCTPTMRIVPVKIVVSSSFL